MKDIVKEQEKIIDGYKELSERQLNLINKLLDMIDRYRRLR